MNLTLVGQLTLPQDGGVRAEWVTVQLSDGDLHVKTTIPMCPLGRTGLALVPDTSLSGTTISLDLSSWDVFDVTGGRRVGVSFATTDPASPMWLEFAELYVRHARHLDSRALAGWVADAVAGVTG